MLYFPPRAGTVVHPAAVQQVRFVGRLPRFSHWTALIGLGRLEEAKQEAWAILQLGRYAAPRGVDHPCLRSFLEDQRYARRTSSANFWRMNVVSRLSLQGDAVSYQEPRRRRVHPGVHLAN
jgi:hypothetical protein